MPTHTARHLLHHILVWLSTQVTHWRARPDAGSHVTEYAIGIGLSAAIALMLMAAFRDGVQEVVGSWFFGGGGD